MIVCQMCTAAHGNQILGPPGAGIESGCEPHNER